MNITPESVSGVSYPRAFRVLLDNPASGTKTATFYNEKIVVVDGKTYSTPLDQVTAALGDIATIQPLDETLQPVGEPVPAEFLLAVLTGLWAQVMTQEPPPPEEPPPEV